MAAGQFLATILGWLTIANGYMALSQRVRTAKATPGRDAADHDRPVAAGRRGRRPAGLTAVVTALAVASFTVLVAFTPGGYASAAVSSRAQQGPTQPGTHTAQVPEFKSQPDAEAEIARQEALLGDAAGKLAALARDKETWDKVAQAAQYVAALHQYVAELRNKATTSLAKLPPAGRPGRAVRADDIHQAIQQAEHLETLEARADHTLLPQALDQQITAITQGLPPEVVAMIRHVVAVDRVFSNLGPDQTGVWVLRPGPGQLALSGFDPASQGIDGRIKIHEKQIAAVRRKIFWHDKWGNRAEVRRLDVDLLRLLKELEDLQKAKGRREDAATRAAQRLNWARQHVAEIEAEARQALAAPSHVWPSTIDLNAIIAAAAKVTGQEAEAQRIARHRQGFIEQLEELRVAMTASANRGRRWLSPAERKLVAKGRTDVTVLTRYLAQWRFGPDREPVPPVSTIIRLEIVPDLQTDRPMAVRQVTTHPDNMESPVTDPGNVLAWGGIHAVQVADPTGAYKVTRFPPYSWLSLIWPFGGTLPIGLHTIAAFDVHLPYLGTDYRVIERSGYTDVKMRSILEMWRINPPGPDLPSFTPFPGTSVKIGLFGSWQGSYIPAGFDASWTDTADGSGRAELNVYKLAGGAPDGRPRRWKDRTRGGDMTMDQLIPGPRDARQLKAGGGLQVGFGWPFDTNNVGAVWNAFAAFVFAVAHHHVNLPHWPWLLPKGHAPGVGTLGAVFQLQVTPEFKLHTPTQAADPRAPPEPELNVSYEIVLSPYIYLGNKDFLWGTGTSGVPGNFVVGRGLASWPELLNIVDDKVISKLPGIGPATRQEITARIRRALAQAEQRVRAEATAQQLAAQWLTHGPASPAAAAATRRLAAAGHDVATDGGTVRVDGITYHTLTTSAATPDKIADAAVAKYRNATAAGQPATGLIIMAGPRAPPADTAQLRGAFARKAAWRARQAAADRQPAALPREVIYIDRDGNVTPVTGPTPADRATLDAVARLAAHGHQVTIWPAATTTGHTVINSGGIPYIRYTPPPAANAAQIAAAAPAAYTAAGTTTGHTTRPGLLIDLTGHATAPATTDLTRAIAPYASALPPHIIILSPDGTPHALSQTILHHDYPALATTSGTTYAVYRFIIRYGKYGKHFVRLRPLGLPEARLTRQATNAVAAYQKAVRDAPAGAIPPRGLKIDLTGIPATTGTRQAVIETLHMALSSPGVVLPERLLISYPSGDEEYQLSRVDGKVEMIRLEQPGAARTTFWPGPPAVAGVQDQTMLEGLTQSTDPAGQANPPGAAGGPASAQNPFHPHSRGSFRPPSGRRGPVPPLVVAGPYQLGYLDFALYPQDSLGRAARSALPASDTPRLTLGEWNLLLSRAYEAMRKYRDWEFGAVLTAGASRHGEVVIRSGTGDEFDSFDSSWEVLLLHAHAWNNDKPGVSAYDILALRQSPYQYGYVLERVKGKTRLTRFYRNGVTSVVKEAEKAVTLDDLRQIQLPLARSYGPGGLIQRTKEADRAEVIARALDYLRASLRPGYTQQLSRALEYARDLALADAREKTYALGSLLQGTPVNARLSAEQAAVLGRYLLIARQQAREAGWTRAAGLLWDAHQALSHSAVYTSQIAGANMAAQRIATQAGAALTAITSGLTHDGELDGNQLPVVRAYLEAAALQLREILEQDLQQETQLTIRYDRADDAVTFLDVLLDPARLRTLPPGRWFIRDAITEEARSAGIGTDGNLQDSPLISYVLTALGEALHYADPSPYRDELMDTARVTAALKGVFLDRIVSGGLVPSPSGAVRQARAGLTDQQIDSDVKLLTSARNHISQESVRLYELRRTGGRVTGPERGTGLPGDFSGGHGWVPHSRRSATARRDTGVARLVPVSRSYRVTAAMLRAAGFGQPPAGGMVKAARRLEAMARQQAATSQALRTVRSQAERRQLRRQLARLAQRRRALLDSMRSRTGWGYWDNLHDRLNQLHREITRIDADLAGERARPAPGRNQDKIKELLAGRARLQRQYQQYAADRRRLIKRLLEGDTGGGWHTVPDRPVVADPAAARQSRLLDDLAALRRPLTEQDYHDLTRLADELARLPYAPGVDGHLYRQALQRLADLLAQISAERARPGGASPQRLRDLSDELGKLIRELTGPQRRFTPPKTPAPRRPAGPAPAILTHHRQVPGYPMLPRPASHLHRPQATLRRPVSQFPHPTTTIIQPHRPAPVSLAPATPPARRTPAAPRHLPALPATTAPAAPRHLPATTATEHAPPPGTTARPPAVTTPAVPRRAQPATPGHFPPAPAHLPPAPAGAATARPGAGNQAATTSLPQFLASSRQPAQHHTPASPSPAQPAGLPRSPAGQGTVTIRPAGAQPYLTGTPAAPASNATATSGRQLPAAPAASNNSTGPASTGTNTSSGSGAAASPPPSPPAQNPPAAQTPPAAQAPPAAAPAPAAPAAPAAQQPDAQAQEQQALAAQQQQQNQAAQQQIQDQNQLNQQQAQTPQSPQAQQPPAQPAAANPPPTEPSTTGPTTGAITPATPDTSTGSTAGTDPTTIAPVPVEPVTVQPVTVEPVAPVAVDPVPVGA